MKNKGIKAKLLTVSLVLGMQLSACLPEERDLDEPSKTSLVSSTTYSASLSNLTLQIQNKVVSDASWFNGFSTSKALDLAAMGIHAENLGTAPKSYICPTGNGTEVQHLVWLDGKGADGTFSLKGAGNIAGAMFTELGTRLGREHVALYSGHNTLTFAEAGKTQSLPSSCAQLSIPKGAPVIVYNIKAPKLPAQEMAKTEYRAVACDNGKRGKKLETRTLRYTKDGLIEQGAWQAHGSQACLADEAVKYEVARIEGGAAVGIAGEATQGDYGDIGLTETLKKNLSMDCVKAVNKTKTASQENTAGYSREGGYKTTASQTSQGINTCSSVVVQPSSAISFDTVGEDVAYRSIACSGAALSGATTLGLFTAQADYSKWSGEARFKRITKTYDNRKSEEGGFGQHGLWEAVSLDCLRTDQATVTCDAVKPNPSYTDLADNADLVYTRGVSIKGFKDAKNYIPNDTSVGEWAKLSGSCGWTETEVLPALACAPGFVSSDGKRTRTITADPLEASGYKYGNWVREEPTDCALATFTVYAGVLDGDYANIEFDLKKGTAKVLKSQNVINRTVYYNVPKLDFDAVCTNAAKKPVIKHEGTSVWRFAWQPDTSVYQYMLQEPSCENGLVGVLRIEDMTQSRPAPHWKLGAAATFSIAPGLKAIETPGTFAEAF